MNTTKIALIEYKRLPFKLKCMSIETAKQIVDYALKYQRFIYSSMTLSVLRKIVYSEFFTCIGFSII